MLFYIAGLSWLLSIVSTRNYIPSVIVQMMFIRWIHYMLIMIGLVYAFVGNPKYDRLFITVYACVTMSWFVLKHECIVSVIEEQVKNPAYKIGDEPTKRAYLADVFGYSYQAYAACVMHLLFVVNAAIVLHRMVGK